MTKCLPYYAWYLRLRKVQTSWINFTFRRTKGLRRGRVGGSFTSQLLSLSHGVFILDTSVIMTLSFYHMI